MPTSLANVWAILGLARRSLKTVVMWSVRIRSESSVEVPGGGLGVGESPAIGCTSRS